jgi:DNA-binding transcriptional ArsR family regulator
LRWLHRSFFSVQDFSLDIFRHGNILGVMPRAATTSDVFNAIAEPRRRDIIELLASGEAQAVNDLVGAMRISQPAMSKHLAVLRAVGVLTMTKEGQRRLYRLNARELKPVHDWVKNYERFWTHQLGRIKQRAERIAKERAAGQQPHDKPHKEK